MAVQAQIAPQAPAAGTVPAVAKDPRGGPGRGQGRKLGSPNYATVVAQNEQLQATANQLASELEAMRKGNAPARQSPVDILEDIAAYWMGVAAKEQADAVTERREPRLALIADALDRASSASGRAAPFRASRLAAVDLGGNKDTPAERSVHVTISPEEAQL